MNLEVDGTNKIILVQDAQGFNLNTESQKFAVAINGIMDVSWMVNVEAPLLNAGTTTRPQLSIDVGTGANQVAAGNHTHTKNDIGLGDVDNTSDASKPVSIAQQSALDGKQNASVNLTTGAAQGTASVRAIAGTGTALTAAASDHTHTKSDLGLSNVDNTSDANKISSGPIKDALDAKSNTNHTHGVTGDVNGTLGDGSTALTLKNIGTAGTYTKVTTDSKGRISSGDNLSASDIPSLTLSKITDKGDAAGKNVGTGSSDVAAGDHTHTDFNALTINGDITFGGSGYTVTNLRAPSNASDAVRKSDLDNVASGLNIKSPVKVATNADITSFPPSGSQTIDGISVTSGNRVLVKNQSTQSQNGIWEVQSGTWTRTTDANQWTSPVAQAIKGAYTLVEEGTEANNGFIFNGAATGTIDSTAITFVKFTTTTSIDAGAGLTKDGNTIFIDLSDVSNTMLEHSTISGISLGSDLNDLNIGTSGLKATSGSSPYNGSAAVTIDIDNTKIPTISGGGQVTLNAATSISLNLPVSGSTLVATTGTSINGKSITLGTTNPSALVASDIGLGNVDNTSDSSKASSGPIKDVLDAKLTTSNNLSELTSTASTARTNIGLGNVDNTSDINKPVSTATQTALNAKQSTSAKDQPSGYAGLNSSGKLTSDKLPSNTYSNIDFLGHSYVAARGAFTGDDVYSNNSVVGVTSLSNRYSTQLSLMLNATEKNHAISGAVATSTTESFGVPFGYGQALKWYPNGGDSRIYSINIGLNDLALYTTASWFTHSLRTMISRLRSNSVTEFTGLSGFSTISLTSASGGSYQQTTSTRTITFSTSSGFVGGTVAIGFMVEDAASASAAITVTGASSKSASQNLISGTDTLSGVTCAVVKRITGLNAGVNNFSITLTVTSGSACVDYWQIESPTPGPLLVHKILKLSTYYPQYTANNRVNLTNIDTWNAAITNLVTEFSGNIFLVDPNTYINKDATYISDDLVHPNDRGHATIAQACYDVIDANSLNDNDLINVKTFKSIVRNNSATGVKVESSLGNSYRQPDKNYPTLGYSTSDYSGIAYPYDYHQGFWASVNYPWGKTAGAITDLEDVNFRRTSDGKISWSGLITKFLYTSGWNETLGNNPRYRGVYNQFYVGDGPFYKNDIVYYSTTSKYYQCKATTPSTSLPTDTTYWNELTIVGSPFCNEITSFDPDQWSSSATYNTGDVTTYRGVTYVSLQLQSSGAGTLNKNPGTNTSYWWPIVNGDSYIDSFTYTTGDIIRRSGINFIYDNATPTVSSSSTNTQGSSSPATNEVQSVVISNATGGTFKLTFNGNQSASTIAWNADAATFKTVLESISGIGSGNTTVVKTGTSGAGTAATYRITFINSLAATNVGQITVTSVSLTNTNRTNLLGFNQARANWFPTIGYSELIATAPSEYLPPVGVQKSFNVLNESGFYSTVVVDYTGLHWYPYGVLFNAGTPLPSNAIAAPPTVNTGWIDLSSISYYTD
jgi:hypothetical protein